MMAVPKIWLYGLLFAIISIAMFPKVELPSKPQDATLDLFQAVMTVPEGETIILMSDWTVSTRGENGGHLEALLRILMRRNIKFALMATAAPEAMQVARDTIGRINRERAEDGARRYEKWVDYVEIGYFPNVEGIFNAMGNNLRTAWAGKTDLQPGVGQVDVFKSPVLEKIRRVEEVALIVDIHASGVAYRMIERLYGKVPLFSMCTGVMGPESLNYYSTGQFKGVVVGLNGGVELETLMENGIHPEGANGAVKAPGRPAIEGFKGMKNKARATDYYLPLHAGLSLLILAVVIGNIGMFAARRRTK